MLLAMKIKASTEGKGRLQLLYHVTPGCTSRIVAKSDEWSMGITKKRKKNNDRHASPGSTMSLT